MADQQTPMPEEWMEEASKWALEFLAVLGADGPDAAADRPRVVHELMDVLDDPAQFHTMLYALVWLAHCMRTSATGEADETGTGVWTFEVHTPLGAVPIDQAPPAIRWVSRWLVACMNGDPATAAALWFDSARTEAQARECMEILVGPLLEFLTRSVRAFLAAGRPLVLPTTGGGPR